MIKKLLFVAVIHLALFSQAQVYNKMLVQDTTTWQHFGYILGVKSSTTYISTNGDALAALDTVSYGANKYRKLYYLNAFPATINYQNKTQIGLLREDSSAKRIYFRESQTDPEYLLYDFSLSTGDSVLLTFPYNAGYTGYYRADSIITRNEVCGPRKHFYMRKHLNNFQPNFMYVDWIESIGASFHLLYIYNSQYMNQMVPYPAGCNHPWASGLACKHNDLAKQYQSCTYQANWGFNYYGTCSYFYFSSGLTHQNLFSYLNFSPIPAKETVTLDFYSEKDAKLKSSITDLSGRTIKSFDTQAFKAGENKYPLSCDGLAPGLYLIILEGDNLKISEKLIIGNY